MQFILGVLAGLLLATILDVAAVAGAHEGRVNLTQSTLALLGGFSSSVVQRFVQRLIEALEAILKGGAERELIAREQENKQRLEDELAKERMRSTLMLVEMQRRLAGGQRPEELQALLGEASRAVLTKDPLLLADGARPPRD